MAFLLHLSPTLKLSGSFLYSKHLRSGDASESLLSSRIPHLEIVRLAEHVEPFHFEIDPDRGFVVPIKGVPTKAIDQRRFTDGRIPDYDGFR